MQRQTMSTAAIFLRLFFVFAPTTILSGLTIYWARNALIANGFHVNDRAYTFVLCAAVWLAMTLTTRPIFAELRRRKGESNKRSVT